MTKLRPALQRLAAVPMFAYCTPAELERIDRVADEIEVTAGNRIIHEGGGGYEFFLIERGEAVVESGGHEVARLGPGRYFGELALLGEPTRDADVIAATDMTLIVIGAREFSALLEDVPSIARSLLRGMARRLQEADRRQ
jgi:CRP/FNR family transcriptional regulator, cyclic AMP receptor protein